MLMDRIICENCVVRINKFRIATQIQILRLNSVAFSNPSIVGWIMNGPIVTWVRGVPGVISIKGKTIAAAKIGMKNVTLFVKYLNGILDNIQRMITIVNRIISG